MEKLTEKEAQKVAEALELCGELRHLQKCHQKLITFAHQDRYTVEIYHHDERYFLHSSSQNAKVLLQSELMDLERKIIKLQEEIREAGIIFNPKGDEDFENDGEVGHGSL
jgi:hypothetical protein